MPSLSHEALLELFRNRPALAPELLQAALQVQLPAYSEVRIDSPDLSQVQPTEYRADLAMLLLEGERVFGIVVEVQLAADERKRFVWPVYVTTLRARLECPVCLLVVTDDDAIARWATTPIEIGGNHRLIPWVLGPSGVPEITDSDQARADPELAVLSAMAHGRDTDTAKSVQIAMAAQLASVSLDADRSKLYVDLILASLSEAARRELQTMDRAKYQYQSDFAKRYVEEGRVEGRVEGREQGEAIGRAALIIRLLQLRFGQLDEAVHASVAQASIVELDAIAERLLTASSAKEALDSQ